MDTTTTLLGLASLILGGGLVGGIVALRKLPAERDLIVVEAAKNVVVMSQGVSDDLRDQVASYRVQVDDLRRQMAEIETRFEERLDRAEQARWTAETALAECHRAREVLVAEYEAEKARNEELCERVEALEAEVAKLRAIATPDITKEKP